MRACIVCGTETASDALGVCVNCIRSGHGDAFIKAAHMRIKAEYGLPAEPPKSEGGIRCNLCSNECMLKEGEISYCGLKENVNGRLQSSTSPEHALVHAYTDPLPTNCCAAWFCPGSAQFGKVNIGNKQLLGLV